MLYADRPLPDQCWPLHTLWMANLLMFQKVPENFTLVNTVTLIGFGSFQSSWSSCWKYTWQKTFRPGWVRLQYTVWSANHYIYVYSMSGLQFCSSDWDDWPLRLSLTMSFFFLNKNLFVVWEKKRGKILEDFTASPNGCLCKRNLW